ncbi:FAS1 domain [Macleaya cordata]|uniref:FAS1 domain n=1 Tax=Macleaya cordata TaxID=56857 RepID=A0A200QHZ3_MACCD|nr:FAS1 domain [Macleaya cordata]
MATKYFYIFLLLIIFFTVTKIKTFATPSTSYSIKTHKPISEIPSIFHSIKSQKPTQQHLQNIIETVMGAGEFSNWTVVLSTTDPSKFPPTATLFIPTDNALSNITDSQFFQFDPSTLAYHILPQRLPFSLLQNFKIGSRIPSLLPNKTILVTNNSESNYTIDNSQITHPDLYINREISVHGIGSLLNYSVFGGGGFLQDHQISDPFSPNVDDDDDQSPPESLPGVTNDHNKPMGIVESNAGWCFGFSPKDIILFVVMNIWFFSGSNISAVLNLEL